MTSRVLKVNIMDGVVLTWLNGAKQDILLFIYLDVQLSVKSFL